MDIVGGSDGVAGWRTWSDLVGRGLGGDYGYCTTPVQPRHACHHSPAVARPTTTTIITIHIPPSRSLMHTSTSTCSPWPHLHPPRPAIDHKFSPDHTTSPPTPRHQPSPTYTPPIPVPAQTPTCTGRRQRPACHPHIARWRCLRPPAAEDETQTHAPSTTMPRTSATQPSSLSCNQHARPSIPSTPITCCCSTIHAHPYRPLQSNHPSSRINTLSSFIPISPTVAHRLRQSSLPSSIKRGQPASSSLLGVVLPLPDNDAPCQPHPCPSLVVLIAAARTRTLAHAPRPQSDLCHRGVALLTRDPTLARSRVLLTPTPSSPSPTLPLA